VTESALIPANDSSAARSGVSARSRSRLARSPAVRGTEERLAGVCDSRVAMLHIVLQNVQRFKALALLPASSALWV